TGDRKLFFDIWTPLQKKIEEEYDELYDNDFNLERIFSSNADIEGNTLLHMAAYMGNTDLLKEICKIEQNDIQNSFELANMWRETPLDMARTRNHPEAVAFLEKYAPQKKKSSKKGSIEVWAFERPY